MVKTPVTKLKHTQTVLIQENLSLNKFIASEEYMKILLIGSGGREHALAWKLAKSPQLPDIICTKGNAGIAEHAELLNIAEDDIDALTAYAINAHIDLVIIGPEAPLALGLADRLHTKGIACFGPSQAAAQLESSKAFCKAFCTRHDIPTAPYGVFTDTRKAKAFLSTLCPPYVIKADGLAQGKGVVVEPQKAQAEQIIDEFFAGRFGQAGKRIIIEAFLEGEEISFFAFSDGKSTRPLLAIQDHKRAYDGDKGPNTGGMGAYWPVPLFTPDLQTQIMERIITPTIIGMQKENNPFQGILFAGLMVGAKGPQLIEYNVRFGDPECQILMRALRSDLVDILQACAHGHLADIPELEWENGAFVNVVMAAKGYPNAYEKGTLIKGIDRANARQGVKVFHAGTHQHNNEVFANGGRVLNITAHGEDISQSTHRAYEAIDKDIDWEEGFCRRDIAYRALPSS